MAHAEGGDGEIAWSVLIRDRSSVVGNRRGREWGGVSTGFSLKAYLVRSPLLSGPWDGLAMPGMEQLLYLPIVSQSLTEAVS